jgi:LacI family transcriptional regulator
VFAAARELNYAPNRIAQGLRTGNSRTIAVLGPSATDPFFAEVVRGIEEVGYERGYEVFLGFVEYQRYALDVNDAGFRAAERRFVDAILAGDWNTAPILGYKHAPENRKEGDIIAKFLARDVGGLILNLGQPDECLREVLAPLDIPLMLFHRQFDDLAASSCTSDDYSGMRAVLDSLFQLGHRRIAMVFGFSWPSHSARDRYRAWVDAHHNQGIALDPSLIREGLYDMKQAGRVTRELLACGDPPSAIVYWSDLMALAGMQAALAAGKRVPGDVSIVGFDDLEFAAYTWPGLASVRQQRLASGRAMASGLIDRIEGLIPSGKGRIMMPVQYMARGSVGAPLRTISSV